jgi:NDP-sugar pyrophosphorylase family protein
MELVILAGGQGKRLRPLTNDLPKCMVPVNGHPMLDHHLNWLRQYNISKIVVACGYKWEKIKDHYGKNLIYSVENEPLGTGGAIKQALEHIEGDQFIVVNSDDLNNTNLNELWRFGSNSVVISHFRSQFGLVETEGHLIKEFRQKPMLPYFANIGLYLLSRDLKFPKKGAFETDLLPALAAKGELKAFHHNGYWITINTMKELEEAEEAISKMPQGFK